MSAMNWVTVLSSIVLAGAALAVVARGMSWLHKLITRVTQFLDDWAGEPARPGVPAVPGVMERVRQLEEVAKRINFEVQPNGGASLIDKINRIEAQLQEAQNDRQLSAQEPMASASA